MCMMLEFKTVDWTRSNYQSNPYVDNPALSALASQVNLVMGILSSNTSVKVSGMSITEAIV